MLQAPNIVAAAGAELLEVILSESPRMKLSVGNSSATNQGAADTLAGKDGFGVRVHETGYIQYYRCGVCGHPAGRKGSGGPLVVPDG